VLPTARFSRAAPSTETSSSHGTQFLLYITLHIRTKSERNKYNVGPLSCSLILPVAVQTIIKEENTTSVQAVIRASGTTICGGYLGAIIGRKRVCDPYTECGMPEFLRGWRRVGKKSVGSVNHKCARHRLLAVEVTIFDAHSSSALA
jgi:hypothetical protein